MDLHPLSILKIVINELFLHYNFYNLSSEDIFSVLQLFSRRAVQSPVKDVSTKKNTTHVL